MPVIQEAFFVPDDIMEGILSGIYRRIGGVVRYATGPNKGQIVKHLDPADVVAEEKASALAKKALSAIKANKKAFIIGGTAIVVVSAGVSTYYYFKKHEPKVVKCFKKDLKEYISHIKAGNLNLETIEHLLDSIEALKSYKYFEEISVQLSIRDIETLVNLIKEYTFKLAKDNNYEDEIQIEQGDNSVIDLQQYLNIQRKIFKAS